MQTLPFLHPDVCIEEAWNAGLSHRVLGYSARQTSIFRSGGEKFAVFVCTKRTSHIPHVVIWFSLIFDREVEGGIWLVCLQMTTASKFYEEFNRKTLVAGCLRSSLRMESTDIVWLVLALTWLFWTFASHSTQESYSPFLGLSPKLCLPTFIGGFRHELWTQSEGQLSTTRYAARLLDWRSQVHRTGKACMSSSASVSSREAYGLFPLQWSTTSWRRLAVDTSLESLKLSPSIIFTFEPLSFKESWRLRWKDVKLTG